MARDANAPARRKTYLRKGIHWMPFEFEAWLEDCRKAGLTPEQVGVFIHVISLMWTDQARLSDDFRRLSVRLGFDVRQAKRIIADLVSLGMLMHADGQIWNPRADKDLAKLRGSYRLANGDLSGKAKQNNETDTTDIDIDSPIVPNAGDDSDLSWWDNRQFIDARKANDRRLWQRMILRDTAKGWPSTLGPAPDDEPTALHDEIDDATADVLRARGIPVPRQTAPASRPFVPRVVAGLALEAVQ